MNIVVYSDGSGPKFKNVPCVDKRFFMASLLTFRNCTSTLAHSALKNHQILRYAFPNFRKIEERLFSICLKKSMFWPNSKNVCTLSKNPISDTRSVTNRVYKTMLLSSCLFSIFCLHDVREWEDDDGSRSRCFCYFCLENDETHLQRSKSSKKYNVLPQIMNQWFYCGIFYPLALFEVLK